MTCECGYADECDGETAIFHPLQDGGMCAVRSCNKPRREPEQREADAPRGCHECAWGKVAGCWRCGSR